MVDGEVVEEEDPEAEIHGIRPHRILGSVILRERKDGDLGFGRALQQGLRLVMWLVAEVRGNRSPHGKVLGLVVAIITTGAIPPLVQAALVQALLQDTRAQALDQRLDDKSGPEGRMVLFKASSFAFVV